MRRPASELFDPVDCSICRFFLAKIAYESGGHQQFPAMPVYPCECTDASIVDRLGVVVQFLLVDFLVGLRVEVKTGLGADGEIAPNFVAMRARAERVS